VPSLADLSSPAAERAAYGLLTGGTVALVLAALVGDTAWIRTSGWVLGAGAIAFAGALGASLGRLARPEPSSAVLGPSVPLGRRRSA
jgi:hypothetical protein